MATAVTLPSRSAPQVNPSDIASVPRDGRLAYSVEEAAALLGISRTSAYLAAQRGELPSKMIGRRRVIPKGALERFLAESHAA